MEFHEIANIFPLLDGADLDALVADIKENGLLEPIVTHDGKIVDGRNRYLACELAGVEPRFEEWKQNGVSLISWVIAKNLRRRHLTSSQGAVCAHEALPFFEAEAKKRHDELSGSWAKNDNEATQIFGEPHTVHLSDGVNLFAESPSSREPTTRGF